MCEGKASYFLRTSQTPCETRRRDTDCSPSGKTSPQDPTFFGGNYLVLWEACRVHGLSGLAMTRKVPQGTTRKRKEDMAYVEGLQWLSRYSRRLQKGEMTKRLVGAQIDPWNTALFTQPSGELPTI